MDFTREPVIETIISPKNGCKLVVRNSKGASQAEYFVEAIEIVSFGNALFYRSTERTKPFLLPVTDYEIVEIKEDRLVLKNVGLRYIGVEKSIRIGNGNKEEKKEFVEESSATRSEDGGDAGKPFNKQDKKKDKKKARKTKKRDEEKLSNREELSLEQTTENVTPVKVDYEHKVDEHAEKEHSFSVDRSGLLVPPPQLIKETLNRYRADDSFKGAFYEKEEEKEEEETVQVVPREVSFEEDDMRLFVPLRKIPQEEEHQSQEPFAFDLSIEEEEEEPQVTLQEERNTSTESLDLAPSIKEELHMAPVEEEKEKNNEE